MVVLTVIFVVVSPVVGVAVVGMVATSTLILMVHVAVRLLPSITEHVTAVVPHGRDALATRAPSDAWPKPPHEAITRAAAVPVELWSPCAVPRSDRATATPAI